MTRRAGRDARHACRTVRAMASQTTGRELTVGALLFHAMTVRASLLRGQAAVGLVAGGANLVTLRRGLLLGSVAAGTSRGLSPGMRFMATRASRVTCSDQAQLSLMASGASDLVRIGLVR
jgi:hypothetical protein